MKTVKDQGRLEICQINLYRKFKQFNVKARFIFTLVTLWNNFTKQVKVAQSLFLHVLKYWSSCS